MKQLIVPIGTTENGTVSESLDAMPAIMVAGTTGSGKNSFVKTIIAELMTVSTPDNVRFAICDSSRIEYARLATSPYLALPIMRDAKESEVLVRIMATESKRRMSLLTRHSKSDYPHLFVVLDDFVALELSGDSLVSVERILQTARLTKMHIMLVTSLPMSLALTDGILSNVDYRAVFRVTSRADSVRTLGQPGANELATPGEMIYRSGSMYTKCKAAYVDEGEIGRQCDEFEALYASEQGGLLSELLQTREDTSEYAGNHSNNEELLRQAAIIVVETGLGSISGLQRKLRVGYATAGRLMSELEARGVVGPPDGSKPRDVLVSSLDECNLRVTAGE